jgi:Ulp1 family protease
MLHFQKIFELHKLLVPIHLRDQNHWVLVVIDFTNKYVRYGIEKEKKQDLLSNRFFITMD